MERFAHALVVVDDENGRGIPRVGFGRVHGMKATRCLRIMASRHAALKSKLPG